MIHLDRVAWRLVDALQRHGKQSAQHLAEAKALAMSRARPDAVVIGADQTLSLDGEIFHKPADHDAARAEMAANAVETGTGEVAVQPRVAQERHRRFCHPLYVFGPAE